MDNYKLLNIKKTFDNVGELDSCTFELETNARSRKNRNTEVTYNVNNPKLLPFLEQCIENSKKELANLQEKLDFVTTGKEARKHERRKIEVKALIYTVSFVLFGVGAVTLALPIWGGPFTLQAIPLVALMGSPILASKIVSSKNFMQKSFAEKSCDIEIADNNSKRVELENIKGHLLGTSKINKDAVERGKDTIRRYKLQQPRTKEEYEALRKFYIDYERKIELEISRSDGMIRKLEHDFFNGIEKPSAMDGIWLSQKKVTYMADRLKSSLIAKSNDIGTKAQSYMQSLSSGAAVQQVFNDPEYKKNAALRKESVELRDRAANLTYEGMRKAIKDYASCKARLEELRRKKGKIIGYIEANDQKFGKTR